MPGTASISGVISGLKTDEIIAKLIEIERVPINRLQAQKATLNSKLSAWQEANTRILALRTKANSLALGSTFDVKRLTSSDDTIILGSASPSSQVGTYYLKINAVARAHQIKTEGFADITTQVGTGELTITVGSGAPVQITIDETNNTLAGIRDAINKSNAGVTASIINDGSESNPYRLVITSNKTGITGTITIEVTGTLPTFTNLQSAQDASLTLGDGEGSEITVYKSSNTITDLIPGITLNLQKADATKTVTITVENDTNAIKQSIKDFVDQYNNLIDYINQQFNYDSETNTGGTLFSDSSLQLILSDITAKTGEPVEGLNQQITLLSQIGITATTSDNKLSIDEFELDEVLKDGTETIKRLFASVGDTTNNAISYVSCTEKTKISGTNGYSIVVTAVATQSRITAGVAQTDVLTQDEEITINNIAINLTSGMTPTQVIAKINEYTSQTGVIASRTDINGQGTGNYLTLTRVGYGNLSISAVSNLSNSQPGQVTSGLGNVLVTQEEFSGEAGTGTGAAGTDVAGTINGEPATGNGQYLTGNVGNQNTEGLKIKITATTPGSYGAIYFTKGVGAILSDYLSFITTADTGAIDAAQDTINSQIKDIDDYIAELEKRIATKEEQLVAKFMAMESALSKLQSQGQFLAGQLAQISNGWK
ncbi:MAG: flagellar filament capping protein FliD [Armatimonadota bacterium]|nr:flagellar filament capping protein FliD [Armatimonadota bacterium]